MGKTIRLKGGVGIGLNDLRINALPTIITQSSLAVTTPLTTTSTLDLSVGALPTIVTSSTLDAGLDDIRVTELPTIVTSSTLDAGLDDIRVREIAPLRLEIAPLKLEIGIRPFRLHLPLNYSFRIGVFGIPLLELSVCGEGMAISEEYTPKETERC